ncbi:unnamed protein product [Nezara viridula]|uniref:Uncharacterized protein n=1 Tax=Nezara viridula TaxID=85310 RepID=A0A9P0HME3_NEZVI|nr:unnamed protein product [Nezara viridula]
MPGIAGAQLPEPKASWRNPPPQCLASPTPVCLRSAPVVESGPLTNVTRNWRNRVVDLEELSGVEDPSPAKTVVPIEEEESFKMRNHLIIIMAQQFCKKPPKKKPSLLHYIKPACKILYLLPSSNTQSL